MRWQLLVLPPLLVLSVAAKGSKGKKKPEVFEDPWSQESLDAALAEVTPLVEKAAGRSFSEPITIELMDAEAHFERMRDEYIWIYGEISPDTPEALRNRMALSGARMIMVGALGKYGPLDKVVYLNQQGIDASVAQAGLSEGQRRDAMKLILAHEIGHALEDQQVDLKETIEELHDTEQFGAAAASWEGLATWIEGQVATDLGTEDVFWALNGLQGWGRAGIQELGSWHTWSTYGQGYRFIGHHASNHGTDQIWKILQDPPASTSQIWRPETYDPTIPKPPRDYAAALRGVEQKLTKGEWMVANTRLGETTLRGEAVHEEGGFDDLEEAMQHVIWAHGLELERPDREGQIRVLEFDDPEWAHRWLELLKAQRTAVNAHHAAEIGVPIEVITEPFEDAPGDDAILRIERIPIGGGRHLERHQAWVVRGSTAVVVTAEKFRPGLRLGWTVEEVFTRLKAQE